MDVRKEETAPESLDARRISAARRVEHCEIGRLRRSPHRARLVTYDNQAQLLQQTLDEEGDTDTFLTAPAQTINVPAE